MKKTTSSMSALANFVIIYTDKIPNFPIYRLKSVIELPTLIQWRNGTDRITGAAGDGLGAGQINTAIIVSSQIGDDPSGTFAAKIAAGYSVQEDAVSACTRSFAGFVYVVTIFLFQFKISTQ